MSARRLLVTGGSGYLGRHVLAAARAAGWSVVGTARSPSAATGLVALELTDAADVSRVVAQVRPDAVVHTAYDKAPDVLWPVVVEGTAAVARAAAEVGARLVLVSSDVVFGGAAGRPYVEADVPDPVNGYGCAKAEAERLVADLCPGAVSVRPSLIVGGRHVSGEPAEPGPHEIAARAADMTFHADVLRCPVQVGDLAAALVELAGPLSSVSGPLHVVGPDAVSRAELAELVVGHPVPSGPAPAGVPLDTRLDASLAASLLTTRLRGVREFLA